MKAHLLALTILALGLAACIPAGPTAPTLTPMPNPTPVPATQPPAATPTPAEIGEDEAGAKPPPAVLEIDGQQQVSGIGTYCWNSVNADGTGVGICADMIGIPTAQEPLRPASSTFKARFDLPLEEAPADLSLAVIPVTPSDELPEAAGQRFWQYKPGEPQPLTAGAPELELTLEPGLYVLSVFARWETRGDVNYGFLVEVPGAAGTPTAGPVTGPLPASCTPADESLKTYVDPDGRYCLLYPVYFRTGDEAPGRVGLYGPALDQSIEPVFAALVVQVLGPADGRTVAQVVDDTIREYSDLPITRQFITLGGQPAEIVEGIPGRTGSWQTFAVHDDTVYQLSLFPVDEAFPQAKPDVDAVWQAVSQSFTFLPK